jgi:signal transduction histidine kinase
MTVRARKLSAVLDAHEAARRRERALIAKILHDETGGLLTTAGFQLQIKKMEGVEGLDEAIEALDKVFDSVRRLSVDLSPDIVNRIGWQQALAALGAQAGKRFGGKVRVNIHPEPQAPAEFYRIAEEAVDNAIRHSGATQIAISLSKKGVLRIHDNGRGFQPDAANEGLGLLLARYLAHRAGAKLRVKSARGQGTILETSKAHAV